MAEDQKRDADGVPHGDAAAGAASASGTGDGAAGASKGDTARPAANGGAGNGEPGPPAWKRALRLPLMLLGPVALCALALWWYLSGGRYESTDDAYVQTANVPISANVAGQVVAIAVHENQHVRRGDLLFRLDDAPFRIVEEEAQARLAAARLQVNELKAAVRTRQLDVQAARDTQAYLEREDARAQRLQAQGLDSQIQADQAAQSARDARARVAASEQQLAAALASLGGDAGLPVDSHPLVRQAQATLDRARLDLGYTRVAAPADGVVTRVEELQVGSHIAAAAALFALVQQAQPWIEANFKEDQLTFLRIGQSATVDIDSLPGHSLHARVASLSPGTGAQFSLLPPENATGNWVKVVQRVPVRLTLDDADRALVLAAGLSATVTVDTGHRRHWTDLLGRAAPRGGESPFAAAAAPPAAAPQLPVAPAAAGRREAAAPAHVSLR